MEKIYVVEISSSHNLSHVTFLFKLLSNWTNTLSAIVNVLMSVF